jgi:CRISPR-associated endonuclease/helicase Cas3
MLDVAAVAEAIAQRDAPCTLSWLACAFGLPGDAVPRWLAAICGLHDFGKAIPGFQAKWPEGQQADEKAGLKFSPAISLNAVRHDLASTAFLRTELAKHFPGSACLQAVTQALGAHHGYFPRSQELREAQPLREGGEWYEARKQLLDAYLAVLQPLEQATLDEIPLPAVAWLAGLVSVADWIGSNQSWFPPGERADLISEHYAKSSRLAERALSDINWPGFQPLLGQDVDTDALIARILGRPTEQVAARPLQLTADSLLKNVVGPALMVVEAPMGEGKTELAFLSHLRLQHTNGHRGLYIALPTQATGNAMFDRALTFLKSFSPDIHLDVQLVHRGVMLDERVHRLRGVDDSEGESITSSAWFSQRKRSLLSPYGVGTIDQALFATLHVKHHFVRLWGLANRVVVLDEVHAYDTYTSGLIEALLRWLKAMNCSVVLMSATLPALRRTAFLRAWGVGDGPDVAYPRVLLADREGVRGEHFLCRPIDPIAVAQIPEKIDELAAAAMNGLSAGGCGCVIVNTVQRAQDLYSILKSKISATFGNDAQLLLFHARYPADERSERESLILTRFGRGKHVRRPARALLIATQVVEQSLDIDFDFMISDLAPVDLLLQRAGRLHRHERQRPTAHAAPRLIVAGLQRDRMPELKETAWGFVYDPYVLYRTWAIAGAEPIWRLPEDIDRLVQSVYSTSDLLEILGTLDEKELKTIDAAYGESRSKLQQQNRQAINVAIDCDAEVQSAYAKTPRGNEEGDGLGLKAVTRLGEDGVTVVPILANSDGWRLCATDAPFNPNAEPSHALAQCIYRRQVRLSRKELVIELRKQEIHKVFESHPLLRDLQPLIFIDGAADFDQMQVRLDPELGVTFEVTEKRSSHDRSTNLQPAR